MALEADWGSSTVLEETRVASAVGFPVPGECVAAFCGARVSRACMSRHGAQYVIAPTGRG